MAKTGVIEGKDLMLYVNTAATDTNPTYTPQAHATSHKVSFNAETKDRKTKDSGKWSEKVISSKAVSISAEALQSYDGTLNKDKLIELWMAENPVLLKYSYKTEATGDVYYEGKFLITSVEDSSPSGEDATYSVNFESTGPVEKKTKAGA